MNNDIHKTAPEHVAHTTPCKNGLERKTYKSPNLTPIGLINQVTLAGGPKPATDSGSFFSPS